MTQKGTAQKSLGQRAAEGEGQAVALEPPASASTEPTNARTCNTSANRLELRVSATALVKARASERIRREAGVTWRR